MTKEEVLKQLQAGEITLEEATKKLKEFDAQADDILHPHRAATERRVREHAVVLVVQDTTEYDLSAHHAKAQQRKGLEVRSSSSCLRGYGSRISIGTETHTTQPFWGISADRLNFVESLATRRGAGLKQGL